ncbi:hypothetical protein F4778DRAFT_251342 [Xylariomycetidae sp. FL2044]|nr:hypothetical protein F4778DRAFT_251342 [Xylariomycetidae sp. FL2044]
MLRLPLPHPNWPICVHSLPCKLRCWLWLFQWSRRPAHQVSAFLTLAINLVQSLLPFSYRAHTRLDPWQLRACRGLVFYLLRTHVSKSDGGAYCHSMPRCTGYLASTNTNRHPHQTLPTPLITTDTLTPRYKGVCLLCTYVDAVPFAVARQLISGHASKKTPCKLSNERTPYHLLEHKGVPYPVSQ